MASEYQTRGYLRPPPLWTLDQEGGLPPPPLDIRPRDQTPPSVLLTSGDHHWKPVQTCSNLHLRLYLDQY